jgi:glutathione peroxidase
MLRQIVCGFLLTVLVLPVMAEDTCPAWLNKEMRLLRSEHSKNLCAAYGGKPMLIVNTASHCGFTKQFKGLEALYQQYKAQGLVVIGFPSDDFKQEANDEQETATVCYGNYGVTFDMFAPISVRGDNAHPLFKELAKQGGGFPKWNFYKYLVNRRGEVVQRFSSLDAPDSESMHKAIEAVLAQP